MKSGLLLETLERYSPYYKRFESLYKDRLKDVLLKFLKGKNVDLNNSVKIKIETQKEIFILEFDKLDRDENKEMIFLISRFDLDRSILYESYRFDIFKADNVIEIVDWHLEEDDYKTIKTRVEKKELNYSC